MNAARNVQVWTAVLAFGSMTALVSAQQPTTPVEAPAAAAQQAVERYVVGQARPPVREGTTLRELTLEEAMAIALEKNLDLQVAKMGPQTVDYQLQAARAAFMPNFTSSYSYSNSQQQSNNTLDGVSTVTSIGQNFNGGMSQTLPWHGSRVNVSFSNGRQSTNNVTTRLNPSYSSRLNMSFNMPLMAGFKIDGTRNQLRTLQIQRQISDIQLLTSIENIKNQVRVSYWSLRSAIEAIEIQTRALDLARRSLADSQIRVEIGTLASIETTQFETGVANAEQQLLNAQINWRTAELNFKRLLVSGTDDPLYEQATINPVDAPQLSVASVDIQAAVTRALQERTDMMETRKSLESTQLGLEVTKNQTKPQLDLSSGYNLSGQGGTQRLNDGTIIPGGYGDALRGLGGFDAPAWNLGFNFSYPLGMRAAKANYARAVLGLEQAQARLKVQELTVSTEVITAGLNVENRFKQFQAAQKSREAQERNTEAAATRFANGMATNFEVVTAQQQLTNSRISELSALIAYVNAIAEFERVQKVGR